MGAGRVLARKSPPRSAAVGTTLTAFWPMRVYFHSCCRRKKVVTTRIEAAGNEDGTSQSATEIVEAQRWKGSVKERPGVEALLRTK